MDEQWRDEDQVVQFENQTVYDKRALGMLNYLAGKSVQRSRSRRTRAFCYALGVLGLVGGVVVFALLPGKRALGTLGLLYGILLLLVGIFWERFQVWSSQRQLVSGVKTCTYTFTDDMISCKTESDTTYYAYRRVYAVTESAEWFGVFFDVNHGIVIDKKGFTQGDPVSFKAFLGQHTRLPIQEF